MRIKLIGRIPLIAIMLMVLSMIILTPPVFASNNLQVIGGEYGIEVIPQDENLFNELNLAPGDTVEGRLTISNNYQDTFALSLRAENLNGTLFNGTPDLSEKLLMKVSLQGDEIYEGPMKGFADEGEISLGEFTPGSEQELEVQVHLPGETTGNEFMGLSVKNQWVLTAQSDTVIIDDEDPPLGPGEIPDEGTEIIEEEEVPIGKAKLPKTGGTPAALFFIAGAAIVSAGVALKKKGQ